LSRAAAAHRRSCSKSLGAQRNVITCRAGGGYRVEHAFRAAAIDFCTRRRSGDFGNEVRPPVTVIAQYLHIVASLQMAEESHTRPRPAAIERTPSLRPIHGLDHWKDRCNTDTSRNEKI